MASSEKRFHAIVETFVNRIVFLPAKFRKGLQCLALIRVQSCGNLNLNVGDDVALGQTLKSRHTQTADPEGGGALGSGWDFQGHSPFEGGNLDFAAEGGCGERDWYFAGEIHAIAGKNFVFLDMNDHVEIAGRATAQPCLATAGAP